MKVTAMTSVAARTAEKMRCCKLLFLVVTITSGCSTPSAADQRSFNILDNTRIEAGLSHGQPYQFAMVSGFTRRGELAQRFEIRHGDCGGTRGWDDCSNDRGRVERKERPKNVFSEPGEGIWYGYSIYIPADFESLWRANTHLSHSKVEGEGMPLWQLTFNDNPYILYSDDTYCSLGSMAMWRGGWNDVTVYAHYGEGGEDVYFQLYRNGVLLCERNHPLMHPSLWGRNQQIGFKYGIYNSFVSRYLRTHDRLPTHVIFYDEMLAGSRREDVDVRMREAAGLPPVD
jgi:hypothetical protein